jgi:L-asparagine oxygenase
MDEIIVSERLRRELAGVLRRASAPAEDFEAFLAHAMSAVGWWPTAEVARLIRFRSDPGAPAALLIRGMPIDEDLPPTPSLPSSRPAKAGHVSEGSILSIAVLLGEPVGYADEKCGSIVQDVFPVASEANASSNESSSSNLDFHTELAFSRRHPEWPLDHACPDFLLILCLRQDPKRQASTYVIEARALCERLSPEHIRVLRAPNFELRAPYSFTRGGDGSRPWSSPVSLIRGPDWSPTIAFDLACGLRAKNADGEEAIQALRDVAREPGVVEAIKLTPGDLLVLNNRRCAHARNTFEARYDGSDRWLHRVYVRRSLDGLQDVAAASWRVL